MVTWWLQWKKRSQATYYKKNFANETSRIYESSRSAQAERQVAHYTGDMVYT